MNTKQIFNAIWQRKWLVFWTAILGAFLAFDIMVLQPPMYKASSRVLVIQKQMAGQDIYAVSKSAQYLSQVLREAVYSDDFFNKTIKASDGELEMENFPANFKDRREKWEDTVKVGVARDLGLVEIDVYYPHQEKARQINLAVTEVLAKEHQSYHGAGDKVEVRVLDYSAVSDNPSALRLWLVTLLGLIIGFLAGCFWAFKKSESGGLEKPADSSFGPAPGQPASQPEQIEYQEPINGLPF